MIHNIDWVKRQAKKYKKLHNVTHTEALNALAISLGYANYKDLLNKSKI